MTGNAFLKRLRFQLDFLSIEDQGVVLSFYENKIQSADTLTQEEEIVSSFGSPELIAEKLKKLYYKHLRELQKENVDSETDIDNSDQTNIGSDQEDSEKAELTSDIQESPFGSEESISDAEKQQLPPAEEKDVCVESDETQPEEWLSDESSAAKEKDDLIFSRAETQEHFSEVIHSIEYDEVMPIFGEKVSLSEDSYETEEIDPMDRENGFTPEEIEEAKKETLQKAKNYTTESFSPVQQEESIPIDVDEAAHIEKPETTDLASFDTSSEGQASQDDSDSKSKEYVGLFNKPFSRSNPSRLTVIAVQVLFTILCAPLMVPAITGMIAIYSTVLLISISFIVLFFLLDLAAIIGGVIELAYGFTLLFDSVSVALIELGLGTSLFGLVVAFSALIYELLSSYMPKFLKATTKRFKTYLKKFICLFYGGKA